MYVITRNNVSYQVNTFSELMFMLFTLNPELKRDTTIYCKSSEHFVCKILRQLGIWLGDISAAPPPNFIIKETLGNKIHTHREVWFQICSVDYPSTLEANNLLNALYAMYMIDRSIFKGNNRLDVFTFWSNYDTQQTWVFEKICRRLNVSCGPGSSPFLKKRRVLVNELI